VALTSLGGECGQSIAWQTYVTLLLSSSWHPEIHLDPLPLTRSSTESLLHKVASVLTLLDCTTSHQNRAVTHAQGQVGAWFTAAAAAATLCSAASISSRAGPAVASCQGSSACKRLPCAASAAVLASTSSQAPSATNSGIASYPLFPFPRRGLNPVRLDAEQWPHAGCQLKRASSLLSHEFSLCLCQCCPDRYRLRWQLLTGVMIANLTKCCTRLLSRVHLLFAYSDYNRMRLILLP